jgi:two-component system, NtrC family, sensor histidine kinase HydH
MTGVVRAQRASLLVRPGAGNDAALDGWSGRRANRVRWIWLVTTISLAAALVAGSYLNYRGVASAAVTLTRGQADILEFAQRDAFRPDAPITLEKLNTFLDAHRGAGLRFVAMLDTAGQVVVSAGQAAAPLSDAPRPTEAEVRAHLLVNLNGRIRSFFPRPPLMPATQRPGSAFAANPGRRTGETPHSFLTVMEFVPVAPGLVASAHRALVISALGAALLTLATLLFWRTSRQYDAARQRLEEQRRLTVLGEMSAVLAHEIRNPLASLKGHAQLLTERLPDGSMERRKAERVVDEAKRLEVLTNDLLDFARSGPMDLQPVNPADLLRACVAEVGNSNLTVDTTGAPQSWLLDERRFCYAVLANLLRNAVQASPPGKPPEARIYCESGQLVFTIRDYGVGLPSGHEHRMFDPFFTTRATGTGLGLALARRIVELHGGRISAQNAEGEGALFRVELPAQKG